ncbi:hypothetical protein ASPCAL00456 [Aspergillus calidoustus]|uniref:Xylanolytic transcriptional activator regulatory domain-containing protein n=1 Tax=Aspergillus calidoustus TaxID=454130 RepID=A0A0U5FUU7_ASPCI|nr:hypothetical protein ASPCAL00456 [Aspergillus calidoustus]
MSRSGAKKLYHVRIANTCGYNASQLRRNTKIGRALIEKQIQLIQERLHRIEINLTHLTSAAKAEQRNDIGLASLGSIDVSPPDRTTQIVQLNPGFEGDSSFASNALLAENIAETTSKENASLPGKHMIHALKNLKNTLELHHSKLSANYTHFPVFRSASQKHNRELPPVEFAVALVRRFKARPTDIFLSCAWRDPSLLETLCQQVYFPSEQVSLGRLTLFYGLLWEQGQYLFPENDPEISTSELRTWLGLCERNFCLGVESYEVLTSQSLENAQALTVGAMRALGLSRPFLCRTLLTAAANICVSLGYHRRSTLQGDRSLLAESKRHVFWLVYMLDKNISLNLGRASNLQDYDIDAELFEPSSDRKYRSYDLLCHAWIHFGRLEGKVYDLVYSVRAMAMPSEDRLAYTASLAQELATWKEAELDQICQGGPDHSDGLKSLILATYPIYYSILTLLYRGNTRSLTGSSLWVSDVCLEAARQSVVCHLKTIPQFLDCPGNQSTYVTWGLLYSSFTPFFVVFISVMTSLNQGDLGLLKSLIDALQSLANVSEGTTRLHSICHAFYQVAEVFLQSKQQVDQSSVVHLDGPSSEALVADSNHSEAALSLAPNDGLEFDLTDFALEGYGIPPMDTQWGQSLFDLIRSDGLDFNNISGNDL